MKSASKILPLLLAAALLGACDGGGGGGDVDAGPVVVDAGPVDTDAGPVGADAGPAEDAGMVDGGGSACTYPEGAVEPLTLDEVIQAYRWPTSIFPDGTDVPLDLAEVACDSDPNFDWGPYEVLVFVTIPEWCPDCRIHAASVVEVEEQFEAAGARLIWVLQETRDFSPGTSVNCRAFMDSQSSTVGQCIGETETMNQTPEGANIFRDSSFAVSRGIDLVVSRRDMVIRYASSHGTPSGNENLTGMQLLERVHGVIDSL